VGQLTVNRHQKKIKYLVYQKSVNGIRALNIVRLMVQCQDMDARNNVNAGFFQQKMKRQ